MINISGILEETIDRPLNGITNYFSNKLENLTNGFVRTFTLSNQEKLTFINDIFIDRCYSISDNNPSSVPIHNLDNGSDISETVRKEPTTWVLNCKFTSIDHKEKYEKLLDIRENSQLITLMFNGQVIENLAIINISRDISNVFYTDFTITLSKLTFVNISIIPSPKSEKIVKPIKETRTGKEVPEKVGPWSKNNNEKNTLKIIDPLGMWSGKGANEFILSHMGVK